VSALGSNTARYRMRTLCHSGLVRQLSSLTGNRRSGLIYTCGTMLAETKVEMPMAKMMDSRGFAETTAKCALTEAVRGEVGC
jgi:hypothetical protein